MRPIWAVILCSIFASGCVRYQVTVNGYTGGQPVSLAGSRMFIQVNNQGPNPLLADEIAQKLTQALKAKGYIPVQTPAEAEYRLEYEYGIDKGQTVTSVSSSSGYQLNTYTGQFQLVPQTGSSSYTFFTRYLFLRVFPLNRPSEGSPKPVWVGEVTSRGWKSNLRQVMDFLIAAGVEHLGENTTDEKRHTYMVDSDPLNDLQPRRPCPTMASQPRPKGADVLDEPRQQPCE